MERNSLFPPEKQAQLKALGATIAEKVRLYFKDPDHRRKFEAWYLRRYGKPYTWKKIEERNSQND